MSNASCQSVKAIKGRKNVWKECVKNDPVDFDWSSLPVGTSRKIHKKGLLLSRARFSNSSAAAANSDTRSRFF